MPQPPIRGRSGLLWSALRMTGRRRRVRQGARARRDGTRAQGRRAAAGAGVLQGGAAAGQGLRLVFVQRVAVPRPVGDRRRRQPPLPCRVDPHAPDAGRIEGDDEGDRVCARGRAQPERRVVAVHLGIRG